LSLQDRIESCKELAATQHFVAASVACRSQSVGVDMRAKGHDARPRGGDLRQPVAQFLQIQRRHGQINDQKLRCLAPMALGERLRDP